MYKYTLKPYLRNRILKRQMDWGFVAQLLHDAGIARSLDNHVALARYSDVTFYSKKKVSFVPSKVGTLLPVVFYDEVEICH